ncbi:uncharacterized protein SOCE836_002200 [Sorangium cellulosum]|uniref:Uncharacterized protein n=1 Tax=Sorangium cellulosum TaxID=56 RepID=A0A4V0NF21_SORCE|nr:uncharacterized protein SOCE836_002200 [Sorangium cellulosum]
MGIRARRPDGGEDPRRARGRRRGARRHPGARCYRAALRAARRVVARRAARPRSPPRALISLQVSSAPSLDGAEVVTTEIAGEEAVKVLASAGQQVARDGSPDATIRLVSEGATWIMI